MSNRTLRISIVSYPPPADGFGGEDQIARWLANAFARLGHVAHISHAHAGAAGWRMHWPDLVINLNMAIVAPLPSECHSLMWLFNSRLGLDDAQRLGWRTITTNSHMLARAHGLPIVEFGCAPEHSAAPAGDIDAQPEECIAGYVGNIHSGKDITLFERRLSGAAHAGLLGIWGTRAWLDHPLFAPCWRGPLDPRHAWPCIATRARTWIDVRSPEQRALESINCRMYELAAAGARVVSDMPAHDDFGTQCAWLDDDKWPDEIIPLLLSTARMNGSEAVSAGNAFAALHSYDARAKQLLDCAGV